MDNEMYDWVDFYKEFAYKLLNYKNNRSELINIVTSTFEEMGMRVPTLDEGGIITDIDPFTIYALFNKSLKPENRIGIISKFKEKMNVEAKLPTKFDSIPVVLNINAIYYQYKSMRKEDDIDKLWEFFETALNYADNQSEDNKNRFITLFDYVINTPGIANSKLTMALYWIKPEFYLNLDRRNLWYIYESKNVEENFVNTLPKVENNIEGSTYVELMTKVRDYINSSNVSFKDFKELSSEAWVKSNEENTRIKNEKEKQKKLEQEKSGLLVDDDNQVQYWMYQPGPQARLWDEFYSKGIMAIGFHEIGRISDYESRNDMIEAFKNNGDPNLSYKNASLGTWEFLKKVKVGDVVFVKKGMNTIIGWGVVKSDYYYDENFDSEYKNQRKVEWKAKGEWPVPNGNKSAVKTLTNITPYTNYVEDLKRLFETELSDEEDETVDTVYKTYTKDDFLKDVYMNEDSYNTLVNVLRNKKNIILEGAPGVGKTYAAKRLAYSMFGEMNQDRVMMIQFHQSYSYEDFIEGIRPKVDEDGFTIKKGSFYNFCKKAEKDEENDYFFIIDEINRGNLSKIFGELLMLIENDKRGHSLQLLYSDEKFFVPSNVYIIGMMNTADRSLALLDYALRRRFAFFDIKPAFENEGFIEYKSKLQSDKFNRLISTIEELNNQIEKDESLGEGFMIGHSYFCNLSEVNDLVLSNIVEYEIVPLIKEYWFDEPSKVNDWINRLRGVIR